MTLYETEFTRRIKSSSTANRTIPSPSPSSTVYPSTPGASTSRHRTSTAAAITPSQGEDVFGQISSPMPTRTASPLTRAKKTKEYGDRFIPTRESSTHAAFQLLPDNGERGAANGTRKTSQGQGTDADARREEVNSMFNHVLREEMFPSAPSPRTRSPANRPQASASRHAHSRQPMSFHTTNIPLPAGNHLVSSAGHTPLHHYPPPAMASSAERGREDREHSPAANLPLLPMHAPTTPISGHGRAPGAGPSSSHYRAHQSQVALTSGQNRRTTPPNSGGRKSAFSPPPSDGVPSPGTPSKKRILNFTSPSAVRVSPFANGLNGAMGVGDLDDMRHEKYNVSPLGNESHRVLQSPRKGIRQIARTPFKVLDAPELADDFYLNLVSWSSSNVLAVGLNSCVYLWSAATSRVDKLCENENSGGEITGLEWTNKGSTIALGTNRGTVEIWDAEYCRKIRTMSGHTGRVGTLAWNAHILSSGSRDRSILHRDTRAPEQYIRKLSGHHKQEVCGLKWNTETNQLASGGNDNKVFIWGGTDSRPTWKFGEHRAAVKAIAWSPHQRGILASGGGTADKKIRIWNSLTGGLVSEWDTGSQVCNLLWSQNSNEIVSTHGYCTGPVQNQIHVWKYPSMTQVATLTGHTYRVLYLAMSPDGQTIVTGAGDETLRFWNAFELERGKKIGTGTARADGDILMGGFGKAQTKGDVMGSMLTLR